MSGRRLVTTIGWADGKVRFLDQTRLPGEEVYIETSDSQRVAEAIRRLEIRGAPAIGVAAAFAVVLAARGSSPAQAMDRVHEALKELRQTRPTAVNLFTALDRMQRAAASRTAGGVEEFAHHLLQEAEAIRQEDVEACRRIGELGAMLIPPGSSVLTHCNAGALATAGIGTALGIITTAARNGRVVCAYVDETRPLLQGSRLTAWELLHAGVEVVLITDSAAATVLAQGKVQAVLVGADRIAANGDTANKVGTYPLAVLAARHRVPFYVAAPLATIDPDTPAGSAITIEERSAAEVTHIGDVHVAPDGVRVFAPAFDVTPNELISAIVTERAVLRPPYTRAIAELGLDRSRVHA